MKKNLPKLTLSRETLRRLDESRLESAGGAIQDGGSMDRTCQSLCFVCPETWPIETGLNNQ
jgi:hypothetical protein